MSFTVPAATLGAAGLSIKTELLTQLHRQKGGEAESMLISRVWEDVSIICEVSTQRVQL